MLDRFSQYQSDILFLLIGTNPLPNYVSARVLAAKGATVYLLHSMDTLQVAERLRRPLSRIHPDLNIISREIDEADGDKIIAKIEVILNEIDSAGKRIGLNYSGGTKSMAVHAYYALRRVFPNGCFSYLDARSLSMVIDPGDLPVQTVAVKSAVQAKLTELLQMHGYRFDAFNREPRWQQLCAAIAGVFAVLESRTQWLSWLKMWKARPPAPRLPDPDEYPLLESVVSALEDLCGGPPTESAVARVLGYSSFVGCQEFFEGKWLEEFVLAELAKIAADVGIHDYGAGIKIKRKGMRNFELDVLAMIGYQLFAISCMATTERNPAEFHLHEVFVRARQIGGDEAHFALVCAVDRPKNLEDEVGETWDVEGKIRVFGGADLLNLSGELQEWFERASQ
jgi:hypothetical protein